ncbi:MAG TPA: amylo-alpha-1,6-glucosidase [Pirellulales bacterium]|jgi:predicted glycogen debranching enzyme|nr:amylo-alpha-1,6-glucosidase [Pirellulales bacterium]
MKLPTIHRTPWSLAERHNSQQLLRREWLVTNGLGGYASGTVSGICTRRYHGLLVAALQSPFGRMMMFNHIAEEISLPNGTRAILSGDSLHDSTSPEAATLASFSLEFGLPVWHYEVESHVLERRILLPYRSNTVHLTYRLLEGNKPVRLRLRPWLHFRPHHEPVDMQSAKPYSVLAAEGRYEINSPNLPPLRMQLCGHPGVLVLDGGRMSESEYAVERERGYDDRESLWSPGHFGADLSAGNQITLIASSESWETILAVPPAAAITAETERRQRLLVGADPRAQSGFAAELVLAADQFIITPTTRLADAVRSHAAGDEIRSVIAGYHWFTDWGRDTMISLEGLTLRTGRQTEAGYILRTFAQYVRDGLIPNLFPEGEKAGLYHTADATLWYFHALDRYLQATGDRPTLQLLMPTLKDIIAHHLRGTRFGIGMDPDDGLLREGEIGYQLTWMDAKMGDWVVTPRRGKPVEINALWYNALRLMAAWLGDMEERATADEMTRHADRARESFNRRFWCENRGWLYDVVDGEKGDDPSMRPNQIFAISLPNPVLDDRRWRPVLDVVVQKLLTPMGLRTLAPGEPEYQPRYDGDLRARDAAYHQGTVWAWLMGPFIDAWLKVYPDRIATAREFLTGFSAHLGEACLGSISEIFDAEAPYTARGCAAQAWSVAEVLRAVVRTTPIEFDIGPSSPQR